MEKPREGKKISAPSGPGEKADHWKECRAKGGICIGWKRLGDISGLSESEFETRLAEIADDEDDVYKTGPTAGAWQVLTQTPIESLQGLRPKVEAMVDVAALQDPVYFALMLTLVSFVLAGFREELWRAGMVALLGRVMPGWFGGQRGNM